MQQPRHVTQYKRLLPWAAVRALLLSHDRYVKLAVEHGMAVNLEAPDLLARFQQGVFPQPGWETEARRRAEDGRQEILKSLRNSFVSLALLTLCAVGLLLVDGKVSPSLPVAWSKVLSVAGGFLAAWATLFELGGLSQTWSAQAAHELVHPRLFALLFLPGTFLAILGQLW